MPDPVRAAAEALLARADKDHRGTWIAAGKLVPLYHVPAECIDALRAALAEHRQRDERGEAAVALAEADAAHQAETAKHGLREEASVAAVQAYHELLAARRRWAEVELKQEKCNVQA